MPELGRFTRELRARFWKPSVQEEVSAEVAYHLDMLEQDLLARGLSPAEARRLARERFGDVSRIEADCRVQGERRDREQRRTRWLSEFVLDVHYALRQLRASPRFTAAAVVTLAIGLGASTTIFGIANAVLLRPPPFPQPERLVIGFERNPSGQDWAVSQPNFLDLRASARAYAELGAFSRRTVSLSGDEAPEQVRGAYATRTFFAALGVNPTLGRTFTEDEDRVGGDVAVAVLGHALWQRRYGGDPGVVGRRVVLAGAPHLVIGVMPEGFDFPEGTEVWTPLAPNPAEDRGDRRLLAVGRLAVGTTFAEADEEWRAIAARLAVDHPSDNADWSARLQPIAEWYVPPQLDARLRALLGAVALLLLMACVNVASLLLARAGARGHEIAVRTALGAGRGRIVRQLLTESVVLALVGGAVGTVLAAAAVPLIRHTGSAAVPRLAELSLDWHVLLFATAACLGTGLLFGLAPALRTATARGSGALVTLRSGTRVSGGGPLRAALTVTSVALATLLLVSAGLVGGSFARLMRVELGFAPEQVLTASVALPRYAYDEERTVRFHAELERRLQALPGVMAAGATNIAPFSGGNTGMGWEVASRTQGTASDHRTAAWRSVTSGYFASLGIPLLRGRLPDDTDRWDTPNVIVINERLARAGWPEGDPLGEQIALSNGNRYTVIGVVGDTRHLALDSLPSAALYFPHRQFPWQSMWLTVRVECARATACDPMWLLPAVRREVAALDPDLPVARAQPLTRLVSDVAAEPRLTAVVFGIFASAALVLAAAGLYGVIAFGVVSRTREIGVRLALGAAPARIVRTVLAQGLRLVGWGLVLGGVLAVIGTRFLRALLYDVQPGDPATYAAVTALLLLVAVAASAGPARRAARLDPATTLRSE